MIDANLWLLLSADFKLFELYDTVSMLTASIFICFVRIRCGYLSVEDCKLIFIDLLPVRC